MRLHSEINNSHKGRVHGTLIRGPLLFLHARANPYSTRLTHPKPVRSHYVCLFTATSIEAQYATRYGGG